MCKFVWRIVVSSNYEEDAELPPYSIDFDTYAEAEKAYNSYMSVKTYYGSHAYACIPPFSVEVVNL